MFGEKKTDQMQKTSCQCKIMFNKLATVVVENEAP